MSVQEDIIDPDLPIIDPHHHLWDLRPLLSMFPEPRHPSSKRSAAPHSIPSTSSLPMRIRTTGAATV